MKGQEVYLDSHSYNTFRLFTLYFSRKCYCLLQIMLLSTTEIMKIPKLLRCVACKLLFGYTAPICFSIFQRTQILSQTAFAAVRSNNINTVMYS